MYGFQQFQHVGSIVMAHRLSCSVACGVLLNHGLNPCHSCWQVDSYPLYHQGSSLADIFDRTRFQGTFGGGPSVSVDVLYRIKCVLIM